MTELSNVTVHDAQLILEGGALLLDVRQHDEFTLGHAPGALHIPLAELPDHLDHLDKNRRIVCTCRSGGRSTRASEFLLGHGFDVVNLEGGMLAWAGEDQPLESENGEPVIG
jgi:rhodanese-related sulfurtransferase